jgi:YidC/Oxa1 family membrane protein insertase
VNPFTALVNFLGQILAFFYGIVPNYGIAIILLTLVISLLLFPLTLKQTRSMKAMQEIQPEVKRLQKEYKDNREEMQKQLMALYQERGVNPAAGCLPLLLQMPIWFALFSVLRVGVENPGTAECVVNSSAIPAGALQDALCAENTHFLGMDLLISPSQAAGSGITTAIPYIILVLIVVAAGFYQQLQTTRRTANSPQQQAQPQGMQTALKIMPIFFGFISWGFPTGLVVYFATSNLFRIAQQSVILRLDREKDHIGVDEADGGGRGSGKGAKAATAEGSRGAQDEAPPTPPRSQPSPHASKKRKKRRRK